MKRLFGLFFVVAVFFGLVSVVAAQDTGTEEVSEALAAAPEWVRETAQRAGDEFFGSVTLESVQFDPEGDSPAYEFSGTAEGVEGFEIDVLPDGMLSEVEETIAEGDVPAGLLDIVLTYIPNFQVEQFERSTRPAKNGLHEVWYEFGGTADFDVEIKEDGSMIVIELPVSM